MSTEPIHSAPAPGADPMVPRMAAVRRVTRETHDTVTLYLDDPEGGGFAPGQFNMLYLFGAGEVAISLSGDPARAGVATHTVRAVGDVTTPLAALKRGATVGVRGPYGSAWPIERARGADLILIAGGIGLAPLRPVIYRVLGERGAFGRVWLVYGARSPAELLYRKELASWREKAQIEVRVIVDRADPEWRGPVGVLTQLIPAIEFDPANAVAMTCGPEVMMRFAARALVARGFREEAIFVSLERNMKCALGLCGHCQLGPEFVCRDGPIFALPRVARYLAVREF